MFLFMNGVTQCIIYCNCEWSTYVFLLWLENQHTNYNVHLHIYILFLFFYFTNMQYNPFCFHVW